MKILVAGGGSGGHVNPALAMAGSLREKYPEARFLFVGSKRGLENDLVPKAGYKLATIPVRGFSRGSFLSKLVPYIVLIFGMIKALFIVIGFRPDLAFGTGGFASGPVLFWTSFFKIPTLIHEANVLPGITNKMLGPKVDVTAVGFAKSADNFQKSRRIEVTGNPLRRELMNVSREDARKSLGLKNDDKLVVIMGGSQGAAPINQAVADMLENHYKAGDFRLIFAPGKRHYDELAGRFANIPEGVQIKSYIYNADVVYNAADLIINRAGAMTMAEITALGIPSILIPSPYVAENHQEDNARALEEAGGCRVILEKHLTGDLLYSSILQILLDVQLTDSMRKSSAGFGIRDATDKLLKLFDELLGKGER
ncbi:MAG: undecaprenyldiphospho-muramoylpentapeptide beta-N-acetylglucosaminyltransferase [Clostridia bacterium]|nr:undecaprenyldiphospho-muramoylpentapeptide beta-N-acetylglucosaminyltransferase [Clostridia bacterium]MBN2881951.1 undecaprenyldiphospho-muramoylpentapeptide beta-N-acetylglucosaminyltransferase [Clostridia bacterium]